MVWHEKKIIFKNQFLIFYIFFSVYACAIVDMVMMKWMYHYWCIDISDIFCVKLGIMKWLPPWLHLMVFWGEKNHISFCHDIDIDMFDISSKKLLFICDFPMVLGVFSMSNIIIKNYFFVGSLELDFFSSKKCHFPMLSPNVFSCFYTIWQDELLS